MILYQTRLKGLPVISREHFCKTRTNCYEILPYSIFTSNTKIGTSNTNCYFKYQLLLQIPIVTSTRCQRPYAMLKAPVPSITVVKQHWAQSVLGWVTAYKRVNHTKDWLALLLARCCIASLFRQLSLTRSALMLICQLSTDRKGCVIYILYIVMFRLNRKRRH
jgi:hypothetical protein